MTCVCLRTRLDSRSTEDSHLFLLEFMLYHTFDPLMFHPMKLFSSQQLKRLFPQSPCLGFPKQDMDHLSNQLKIFLKLTIICLNVMNLRNTKCTSCSPVKFEAVRYSLGTRKDNVMKFFAVNIMH